MRDDHARVVGVSDFTRRTAGLEPEIGWPEPMELREPTTLYRLFDAEGVLLYVGITGRGHARIRDHARDKPWWPDVARATFESHLTKAAALEAERLAIRLELPVHNQRKKRRCASCGTERVKARGLCGACYERRRRRTRDEEAVIRANQLALERHQAREVLRGMLGKVTPL